MKSYFFNIHLIMILVNILLLFSKIKSQESHALEEMQLFNNSLILFNKSTENYQSISEKMKNIKYNIFLKLRYRIIKRNYIEVKNSFAKIKEILESKNYDNKQIKEKIIDLNRDIYKFNKRCNKALEVFSKNEEIKKVTLKLIKVFFLTALIIIIFIIIILAIIALFSFIIYKRQKIYHGLREETTNISGVELKVSNDYKSSMDRIKEKNQAAEKNGTKKKTKAKKDKIENTSNESY